MEDIMFRLNENKELTQLVKVKSRFVCKNLQVVL